ncbi:MAG: ATP-binding protein [Anaerolineaceae bacterium]|nr:ATP-binding protein [Anaerolineaceae bacterium]
MTRIVRENILVVENDVVIADMIAVQALEAAGYQVQVAENATIAIQKAMRMLPDLIIVNLQLPGLSGKDLMVALTSQRVDTPVIVLAHKGMETDIIQAYRLGAADYLLWPVRESEVLTVVDRVLKRGRERGERDSLASQLQNSNSELQSRVREMNTIISIGKAVTSVTDQVVLFDRILEGATSITKSDVSWFLLRNEASKTFFLVSYQNLPQSLASYLNQLWDDGISSLVTMSGESLSITGDSLKKFKISSLGQAALIVPIKAQSNVIGLIVVLRKRPVGFTKNDQKLLEAVADYASISLVNARLFRAVEERAITLESAADHSRAGEKIYNGLLESVKKEISEPLESAHSAMEFLMEYESTYTQKQREVMADLMRQLDTLSLVVETLSPLPRSLNISNRIDLNDIVFQSIKRAEIIARESNISILLEMPSSNLMVRADPQLITQVMDALLSNAIKFNEQGGQVTVQIKRMAKDMAQVQVRDTGSGISQREISHIFGGEVKAGLEKRQRFGGLGIGLALVEEIITNQEGEIWVDSKPGKGATFNFILPMFK